MERLTGEVNMSGKIYFSVRRNALSPFIATTEYAQVKVLGTEFEVTECKRIRLPVCM